MTENAILLVDADGDSETIVSEGATRSGRDLIMTKTSRDAFRIFRDEMGRLDLVIVDVDPGAHGLALLEAISNCADAPPILVITALEETYMNPIAKEHGAVACLGKPVEIEKLKSVLDDVAVYRSLTSDRWGRLVPRRTEARIDVEGGFRGIAAKLSPGGPARRGKLI